MRHPGLASEADSLLASERALLLGWKLETAVFLLVTAPDLQTIEDSLTPSDWIRLRDGFIATLRKEGYYVPEHP